MNLYTNRLLSIRVEKQTPLYLCLLHSTVEASTDISLTSHLYDCSSIHSCLNSTSYLLLAGISYLRPADESKLRDKLMEKAEAKQTVSTPIAVKGEDKKFIDSIMLVFSCELIHCIMCGMGRVWHAEVS